MTKEKYLKIQNKALNKLLKDIYGQVKFKINKGFYYVNVRDDFVNDIRRYRDEISNSRACTIIVEYLCNKFKCLDFCIENNTPRGFKISWKLKYDPADDALTDDEFAAKYRTGDPKDYPKKIVYKKEGEDSLLLCPTCNHILYRYKVVETVHGEQCPECGQKLLWGLIKEEELPKKKKRKVRK